MKNLNLFSAAALTLLFFKGTQTPFFGVVPSWFAVILPLVIGWLIDLLITLNSVYGWTKQIEHFFWSHGIEKFVQKERKKSVDQIVKQKKFNYHNDPNNSHK